MSLKARITAWLVRDAEALFQQAEAQKSAAAERHRDAVEKLAAAEEQAQKLRRMDQRNHYSESLHKTYIPKGHPA